MDVVEHIDFLQHEGELLASAATDVDPDTPVATVPDWPLRDLVRHVGGIHRWATTTIREARTERYDTTLLEVVGEWPDDADLVDWFRSGHAALVQTLRDADPELECWSFFAAPTPIAFWARRQTHETAIHRADAQSCTGPISPYAPELAADGIDEILFGFAARRGRYPETDPPRVRLRATDVDREWWAQLGPEHTEVVVDRDIPAAAPSDVTVDAPASDLYLLLWNRIAPDAVPVDGDPEALGLARHGPGPLERVTPQPVARARKATGQGSAARATPPICCGIGRTPSNSGVSSYSSISRRTARPIAESENRCAGHRCGPWPNVVTSSRRKRRLVAQATTGPAVGVEPVEARHRGRVRQRQHRREHDPGLQLVRRRAVAQLAPLEHRAHHDRPLAEPDRLEHAPFEQAVVTGGDARVHLGMQQHERERPTQRGEQVGHRRDVQQHDVAGDPRAALELRSCRPTAGRSPRGTRRRAPASSSSATDELDAASAARSTLRSAPAATARSGCTNASAPSSCSKSAISSSSSGGAPRRRPSSTRARGDARAGAPARTPRTFPRHRARRSGA